ncbi:hypothetical protein [Hydrogenimonas sp.]
MKPLKFFVASLAVLLMAEIFVPYPRPDTTDLNELFFKEVVNGTFFKAVGQSIAANRQPLDRYTEAPNAVLDRLSKGERSVYDVDADNTVFDIAKLKETIFQPYYVEAGDGEPEIIYDPRRYYSSLEPEGKRTYKNPYYRDGDETVFWGVYYNDEGGGIIFAVKQGRDEESDNQFPVAYRFSNLDRSFSRIGTMPFTTPLSEHGPFFSYSTMPGDGGIYVFLDRELWWVGGDTRKLYTFSDDNHTAFSIIHGAVLVRDGETFKVVDGRGNVKLTFDPSNETFPPKNNESEECFIGMDTERYHASAVIGKKIYVPYKGGSLGIWRTGGGEWKWIPQWSPIHCYSVMGKYDYHDGGVSRKVKSLKYNLRKYGVVVKDRFPKGDLLYRYNMYGDILFDNTRGKMIQTFDFKRWNDVCDWKNTDEIYRFWINPADEGVVGLAGSIKYGNPYIYTNYVLLKR